MRNKEQEMAWRKVIEACMEDVKHHFDDIQQAIEFGCYIQPDNYFVSYIFATDSQLETARQSGLTEQINSYHREQLIKSQSSPHSIGAKAKINNEYTLFYKGLRKYEKAPW